MPDQLPPQHQRTRRFLVVTTIASVLGAVLGLIPALTSFFLFDAPGSEKNPATIALFVSALSLPLTCVVAIALSWILYRLGHHAIARWSSLLPLLNLLTGGLALIYLQLLCNGRFAC